MHTFTCPLMYPPVRSVNDDDDDDDYINDDGYNNDDDGEKGELEKVGN